MATTSVSIRELRDRLSHYLRLTKAGQSLEITERGVPIGRIVPTTLPIEDRVQLIARTGLLAWNQQKMASRKPVARIRGSRTVADLLLEDRE